MGYIDDYVYYGSGHDCPRPYMEWGALSLISHLAGRKVWTMHGDYFRVLPNLYVCNIGPAGSGKSTAMEQNENIMKAHFPHYLLSSSIQSAQHILKVMTQPECEITWKDDRNWLGQQGKIHTYRSFYCLVDEMTNFVSVDKETMVNMLVGIYARSSFDTGFKKEMELGASQRIEAPYFSLMGCAIPEWVMYNLKIDLFVGGLGRRLIIVHAKKERESDDPKWPPGAQAALTRAIEHVKKIENPAFNGPFVKSPEGVKWWKAWFNDPKRKNREDPLLMQFDETKHIQLLKVAMMYAMAEPEFEQRLITEAHFERARKSLDALMPEIARLTGGVGRNEIAGVGVAMLEHIRKMGGILPEASLMKAYHRYLRDPEFQELCNHYVKTGQVYVLDIPGQNKRLWLTPEAFQGCQKLVDDRKIRLDEAVRLWFEAGLDPTTRVAPLATT